MSFIWKENWKRAARKDIVGAADDFDLVRVEDVEGLVRVVSDLTVTGTLDIGGSVIASGGLWVADDAVVSGDLGVVGNIGSGTWQADVIDEVYGGTAQSGYTTGEILYASATDTLSRLSPGAEGQVLHTNGGVPNWATLNQVFSFDMGATVGTGVPIADYESITEAIASGENVLHVIGSTVETADIDIGSDGLFIRWYGNSQSNLGSYGFVFGGDYRLFLEGTGEIIYDYSSGTKNMVEANGNTSCGVTIKDLIITGTHTGTDSRVVNAGSMKINGVEFDISGGSNTFVAQRSDGTNIFDNCIVGAAAISTAISGSHTMLNNCKFLGDLTLRSNSHQFSNSTVDGTLTLHADSSGILVGLCRYDAATDNGTDNNFVGCVEF